MPFVKGKSGNLQGKPPGVLNRTTKEAKEILEQVLLGQVDNIKEALQEVKDNDPAKYLDACSKLFTYVLPKKTDVTSNLEQIKNVNEVILTDEQLNKVIESMKPDGRH